MPCRRSILGLLPLVLLSACGGGGSDGGSGNPPPAPQSYTVGGTSSGIAGTGLSLQLNGSQDLALPAAGGTFTFATPLTAGSSYTITIKSQPTNPSQTCVLANASGSIGTANVTNASVTCTTNSYALSGKVNGLSGTGLVLHNSDGSDLPISSSGDFVFGSHVSSGSAYAVTVKTQPSSPSQTCTVSTGSGTVVAADITNVSVNCATNTYSIGGATSGLVGTGLVLSLTGSPDLPLSANGNFGFPGVFASGSNYAVTVKTQPTNPHQTCVASNASGTVVGGAVTNIAVTCTTNTYSVGGSVSGLTGTGLVLQLNGGQDLPMNADGDFVFPTKIASGAQYAVTVKDQSSTYREVCQASNANGTIGGSAISSVTITCTVVSGFVYVTTGMYGDISTYGLQQDGTLTSLGSTVSVGVLPQALVAAPNGKTLYATNFAANTIAAFAVDSSRGTLTTLGSGPLDGSSTGAQSLAILPSGKFLYALNANTRNIHRFSIDATTGALTAAGVVATPSADDSVDIAITPDGAFLYVLARTVAPAATVTAYSIDPVTGALSAGATTSLGRLDRGLVIDPLGRTLYLRRSADPPPPGGPQTTLFPFTIDAGTGALTAVGTGTVAASSGQDFAIDPSGQYAYLLDAFNLTTNNHIDTFAIDASTGALTGIGSSTRVATLPTQIICDPSGRFVFVGSGRYEASNSASTWYDVLGFEIGATGPAAGQLSATGQGTGHVGNYGGGATGQVAVIE